MEIETKKSISVDTYIHPAEYDNISAQDLHKLVKSFGRTSRELVFLKQDIIRCEKYEKKIIYLLDFSELFSYLWPTESRSQSKEYIRYLFTSSEIEFVLPPGAILELIYRLKKISDIQEYSRKKITNLFNNPFFEKFFEELKFDINEINNYSKNTDNFFDELITSIQSIIELSDPINKLIELFNSGKLKTFNSYDINIETLLPDQETFNLLYNELAANRSFAEETTNYVDAYNYAFVYALNEKYYETRNYFFLLITSSPIPYSVFEQFKWKKDPLTLATPSMIIRTSLVRHPVQLLYLNFLKSENLCYSKSLNKIIKNVESLHKDWSNISTYIKYLSKHYYYSDKKINLPKNRKYKEHISQFIGWYDRIFRPVAELISSNIAQEQNIRRLKNVGRSDTNLIYLYDEAQKRGNEIGSPDAQLNFRNIINLFDRLINITKNQISVAQNNLNNFSKNLLNEIDEGQILDYDKLKIKNIYNEKLECNEYTLFTSRIESKNNIFLCADKYSDYISFWWRTNVEFTEFIKAVRYYIRSILQAKKRGEFNNEIICKKREFSGIYFYLEDDIKHIPIERLKTEFLNAENIYKFCEPNWSIKYIRIAMEYGDFCYDFLPISFFPQRAGLVTNLCSVQPLTDFIQWTNIKYIAKKEISVKITKIIN